MTTNEIISELLKEIQKSIDSFNESIPDIQKVIFRKVQRLLKDLDTVGDNLTNSDANLELIKKLRVEINNSILNDQYTTNVADFTEAFTTITTLQNAYFESLNVDFVPRDVNILKLDAIDETIVSLTEAGISNEVTGGIVDILKANIVGESNYSDLIDQMRDHILSGEDGGALERYTTQITTDALNQYSAQYNQLVTSDLNFKWRQYVGSLKEKSREECIKLVKKRWIHESELPDILEGKIDGFQVPINPKTGLWYGAIQGTTVDTFPTYRGGWNCGHQYFGVSEILVPIEIRRALYEKIGDQKALLALD